MSKHTLGVNNRPRRFWWFGYRVQTTKSVRLPHTEPQRGVSKTNRRIAAALRSEMKPHSTEWEFPR